LKEDNPTNLSLEEACDLLDTFAQFGGSSSDGCELK